MKIYFQNLKYKRNKGFTLVELIVVLVILAILAAILVPALLGYIDRAKEHQYLVEARDLMVASEVAIMEAYAKEGTDAQHPMKTSAFCRKLVAMNITCDPRTLVKSVDIAQ